MIKKIPISGTKLGIMSVWASLISLFDDKRIVLKLKKIVQKYTQSEHVFFLNSGLSCLSAILEALKNKSAKTEVILPAYTAGSLIVAIQKADLKPVLCEVSPEDFNFDSNFLDKIVCSNTLCIIAVHMFGIAAVDIEKIKNKYPDIVIVEDACQSMGTVINNKSVGNLGHLSFFSLNKGKNLSTFGGGIIATNDLSLSEKIKAQGTKSKKQSLLRKIEIFIKLIVLSVVVNPIVYGLLYPIVERFKETAPPENVEIKDYTGLQAHLACSLFEKLGRASDERYANGMSLIAGLSSEKQLILPQIAENSKPAFNRLPIVFRDLKKRQRVEVKLKQAGIETSRMYLKPLHHMFDLGYAWGNFPNAVFLAGHLLTLPCHPLLKQSDIDKIIKIIKSA
ncbi:MAG: DegT/DnrJ/EryC1/StrS family aminotransferase [Candidatus Omnitrophica bacterium]|nr:DegT/DnrJ/EryC1/StrS family aminotransferase [Candidatus Omnitrophota bacterium]